MPRRGGGVVTAPTGAVLHSGTWVSPIIMFPLAWGWAVRTNPSIGTPLPCFRSGDVTDWSASNGVVFSPSIDATSKCEGTYSMKLTATSGSLNEYVEVAVDDIDYTDFDQLEMDLYANTTQTDLLIVSIKNNGSWYEVGRIEVSIVNTLTPITMSLSGIPHDDVEMLRITSNYDTAFEAYVDRFVFTFSKTSPWKTLDWSSNLPFGTEVKADVLNGYTGATIVLNVANGTDLGTVVPSDVPIQIKFTLTTSIKGSTPEVVWMQQNWIPDRFGDWRGEERLYYEYIYT